MHAVVDARVGHLLHEVVDLRPAPRRALGGVTGRRQGRHGASTDLRLQHRADGAGDDAVRAWILGVHGSVDERRPRRIPFRRVVAVGVTVADRGDRPPEVVVVFGVQDGDSASSMACVTAANKRAFCVTSRPGSVATERTTP